MDREARRRALRDGIAAYEAAVEDGREEESDAHIGALERIVPHAGISDLIFWGEKERTMEEVVIEADAREALFEEQGALALLLRREAQLRRAAGDESLRELYRSYAQDQLPKLQAEIRALAGPSLH